MLKGAAGFFARGRLMFWLGVMQHLAEIALVEILPANWAMLEMLRLGLP